MVSHPEPDPRDRWPHRQRSDTALSGEEGLLSLPELLSALKRSVWIINGCLLAMVVMAIAYVITTPPSFVANAQLLITAAKQQFMLQESNTVEMTVDGAAVESQVEVLRSERIANDVISRLGLANDPEFRSDDAGSDYERQRITLARFRDALDARRIRESYVIEVSFRSSDPDKAARITNAIAEAYIRDELRAKADTAQQASYWMEGRVTSLGMQLNVAAAAVQKFRTANGIVDNSNSNNSQPRLIDQLTELEARAEAYRRLYESFLQKLTGNQEQGTYPVSNARIITAASTPLVKSYPKTKLILMLSILLGLSVGAAIAVARSFLDHRVRSAAQIRQMLGLECLGSVPRFGHGRNGKQESKYDEVLDGSPAPFADAIRSIKISLQNIRSGNATLRFGILSLNPGEGTSTLALNLATSFAASGSKTLLIDANLREPSLSRRFAHGAERGLIEALRDGPDGTIRSVPKQGFHILPVVDGNCTLHPADLLGSEAMRALWSRIEPLFATIIVDLPSSARVVDARVFGPLLDGCILVAEWGRASLQELRDAVDLLRTDQVRVLGAVLNKTQDGIPPLFGFHLTHLRGLGQAAYIDRLMQAVSRS